MAATYLTIGSKFRPFSYDELVRPLQEATEAHQALETEYADLDTRAGIWENIANEQTDPITYRMYKQYSDDLKAQADILATQGLTPGTRQNLMRMKSRYSQEITPIENAYTRRRTLADEQRKALAENPTLMFQRDVNTMSLDDFIANPELDYGASYSGALLTQQVSNAAANLRREMQNNPRKWQSILGGQYYETLMRTGFTSDEINKAIAGAEDANPILTGIVNDVLSSSGMGNWADEFTMSKARAYANQGLWGAIGETGYDTLQNRQWGLPLGGPEYPEDSALGAGTVDWGVHSALSKRQERKLGERVENTSRLEETTYDGDTYYLSPELKSYAYFVEHPEEAEEYAEWRKEQWRKTLEEDPRLKQYSNGILDGMTESEILYYNSVRKKFERAYPEIPSKEQLNKLIETEQKDNQIEEASKKYSYLSDNELQNIKLGTAYEQASHHIPKTTTPFASNNKSTAVSNFIDNIQRTPARMYEYDMESMSYKEKPLDVKRASEARQKVNSVSLDRDGRVILETTDGKFYYWEGTNIDKSTQKRIQSAVMALTNFSKEFSERTEPDGSIQLPGIGELEDRPRLSDEQLQEGTIIKGFNTLVENGVIKPIISSGNVLWFRATVTNSEGLPVNVLINNNGMIVGKMSLDQVIRGGGTQAFWLIEDLKNLAIDEWLNAASKGTE